jgi:hypothetical protein
MTRAIAAQQWEHRTLLKHLCNNGIRPHWCNNVTDFLATMITEDIVGKHFCTTMTLDHISEKMP